MQAACKFQRGTQDTVEIYGGKSCAIHLENTSVRARLFLLAKHTS